LHAHRQQGLKVACLEEIAYQMEYISPAQLMTLAKPMINNGYGQYLVNLVNREKY
jgi:glucose-1-phosphate thymidylyltransferase